MAQPARIPASSPRQNTCTLSTSVPQDTKRMIQRYARRRGISTAEAVRRLIAIGLTERACL
jgi:hypothetical protein